MIDETIRTLAMGDWITPLFSLIHKLVFRAVGYNVPESCGWSLYAIRDLLKSCGIGTRWPAIVGPVGAGTMTFNVARRHDWQAQGIMRAYGIPYTGGRTFSRPPFLPGAQAGPGQPTAQTIPAPRRPTPAPRRAGRGSALSRLAAAVRREVLN